MPVVPVGPWRVRYEEQGTGDVVVLLSGLGADLHAWDLQRPALAERFRVLVLDNPGAGSTAGPEVPLTTARMADLVAELLGTLGIERAHAVGISLGGCIAQELALRHPGLVRSLGLHATWGRADGHLAAILTSLGRTAAVQPPLDVHRQLWPLAYTVWWHNDSPDARERLERELRESLGPDAGEGFRRQVQACIEHDALGRLSEIAVPTLLSVGDRDMLTPAHHTYAMKDCMPGARVRLWQKMGHMPHHEAPEEFNRVTVELVESAP